MTYVVEFATPSEANAWTLDHPTLSQLDVGNTLESGDAWTDITAYVTSVSVARGRQRALDAMQAGRVTVRLRDESRLFDPTNTLSAFAGKLTPGRGVRVWADGVLIGSGRVIDYSATHSLGDFVEVEIDAADQLAILANTTVESHTPTSQDTGARVTALLDRTEVNYGYARSIGTGGSTCGTETVQGNTLALLDRVAVAEQGVLFCSHDGVLTFTPRSSYYNASPVHTFTDCASALHTNYGAARVATTGSGGPMDFTGDFSLYLDLRADVVNGQGGIALAGRTSLLADWSFLMVGTLSGSTGYLTCNVGGSTGTIDMPAAFQTALYSGERVRLRLRFDADDGGVSKLIADYALPGDSPDADLMDETWTTFGTLNYGALVTPGSSSGHVQFGAINSTLTAALRYYRIVARDSIATTAMAPTFDWLAEYNGADLVDRYGTAVSLQGDAVVAADTTTARSKYRALSFTFGGEETYTRVEVTRSGGTLQAATNAADISGGTRTLSITDVPLSSDTDADNLAEWLAGTLADPGLRFTSVSVQAAGLSAGERFALFHLDIGEVVRMVRTRTPAGEPVQTIADCIVQGVRHEIDDAGTSHIVTLALSPNPYAAAPIWTLDDPVLSVLDGANVLAY